MRETTQSLPCFLPGIATYLHCTQCALSLGRQSCLHKRVAFKENPAAHKRSEPTASLEAVANLGAAHQQMVDARREREVGSDAEAQSAGLEDAAHAAHDLHTLACLARCNGVCLRVGARLPQRRPDIPRRNCVDADVVRRLVDRERLGERRERALGRGVYVRGGGARVAAVSARRRGEAAPVASTCEPVAVRYIRYIRYARRVDVSPSRALDRPRRNLQLHALPWPKAPAKDEMLMMLPSTLRKNGSEYLHSANAETKLSCDSTYAEGLSDESG